MDSWIAIVEKFGVIAGMLLFFVWWTYRKDEKDRDEREKRESDLAKKLDEKDARIERQTDFVQSEMLIAINNNTDAQKDVSRALDRTNAQQRQTLASLDAIATKLDLREAVEEAIRKETDSHPALPRPGSPRPGDSRQ